MFIQLQKCGKKNYFQWLRLALFKAESTDRKYTFNVQLCDSETLTETIALFFNLDFVIIKNEVSKS